MAFDPLDFARLLNEDNVFQAIANDNFPLLNEALDRIIIGRLYYAVLIKLRDKFE